MNNINRNIVLALFSLLALSSSVKAQNVCLFDYINEKYCSNIRPQKIDRKLVSISSTDTSISIPIEKEGLKIVMNQNISKGFFNVANFKIDSIYPGNQEFSGDWDVLSIDTSNILWINDSTKNLVILPISNEGCNGESCSVFFSFAIFYETDKRNARAYFFCNKYYKAPLFNFKDNTFTFTDILDNSDNSTPKDLTSRIRLLKSHLYVYFKTYALNANRLNWISHNIESPVLKAPLNMYGDINDVCSFTIAATTFRK